MATPPDYIAYVAERLAFIGNLRYKKMFGEYMVYIGDKPLLLVCDNTVFVKILPCLDGLLTEKGFPYEGAKEHYVLDFEDSELAEKVIRLLDEAAPMPKPKQTKKKNEATYIKEVLKFSDRAAFRKWLQANGTSSDGVWLLFGKKGGPETLKAAEALEEALCFGWIDGQMQSLDSTTYKKYFARRTANSKWSDKNKSLVQKLEEQGIITDYGRQKIAEAKENGGWDAAKSLPIADEHIATLSDLLKEHEPAYTNFQAMPPSVKKTYARAYFDAKTDSSRESRLSWMIDRLNKNLKPMQQ